MTQWVRRGLRTGIKTTRYPRETESAPGVSPGIPVGGPCHPSKVRELVDLCPTGALAGTEDGIVVHEGRCVHCYRCTREARSPIAWKSDYAWAARAEGRAPLGAAFQQSVHILVVDAGDCGACLNEVRQLNGPYYNMHRLGFFVTPTPRQADVLLVVGAGTDHMLLPLQKAYEAMPTPKRVVAVGACALSGSVFGPNFVCAPGIRDIVTVDVEVPGQPPPPLAILHGLLVAVGRAAPSSLTADPVR